MILDSLTLHNFGVYAGRQTIDLAPPSPQQPVVLIGGLNGGGKTSLLDAIQLCLFGPHAKISNRANLVYSDYLSRSIHRRSGVAEAAIELTFRHTVEGAEDHYMLHRSWRRSDSGCKERLEVFKNGRAEPVLAENWATQVDDFIPAHIAHLFLFDGEQIESYADQENSAALIGSAIQNLLGLDIVDQLEKDLVVYERRKRTESKDESAQAQIQKVDSELKALRARSDELNQARASLQVHKLDRKQRSLREIEDQYRKVGGPLYEQKASIERALSKAEQVVRSGETEMRNLAGGALPLTLVRNLLTSMDTRDRKEQEIRSSRDLLNGLKQRDQVLLKHLRAHCKDAKTIKEVQAFLEEDRAERSELSKKDIILDMLPETRSDLQFLLRSGLKEAMVEAGNKHTKQLEDRRQVEQIQSEQQSIPSQDMIAELVREREKLRKEIADLEAEYNGLGYEIERLGREIVRTQQALARLLESDAKVEADRQDRARILRHSGKVRTAISGFRRAVIERHVRRIEHLVHESYAQLLRKASLITRLSIDPDTFKLALYGRDGEIFSAERLSAGERQLLAIAMLWGLAKASGRPLPAAIDTPLGRLDMTHRMHLVERYFPFASHQVLLLSTDEEIAGQYLHKLKPWIGRTYELVYDDTTGGTRIVPGYFEGREAA